MERDQTHVVIVGGGFAGLNAARELRRAPLRVTLVDRRNYHLFFPLLYQVATAGLNPADIAAPIRHVLRRQKNATVLLGEATAIDPTARKVILSDGEIAYDYLIVAAGSTASYFGRDEWAAHAPGLLDMDEALEVRRRLLLAYEEAEREEDPARLAERLTIVVIGGGPTGVELAGAIAEMARHTLAGDFRRIDPRRTRVILLERSPRILPAFHEDLSARARASLERLGVEIRSETLVTHVDEAGVTTGSERIASRCVLWAAGIQASPLARSLGATVGRAGRVLVNPDLSVPGHPEVFVAGDLAAVRSDGGFVPGLAPAAIQAGRRAARNVMRSIGGDATAPFLYDDRGMLATIGRAAAVAEFGRLRLSGFIAWVAWLVIHIYFLIGFRSRLLVLFEWAWAYVTYERGVRLVTRARGSSGRAGFKIGCMGIALAMVMAAGATPFMARTSEPGSAERSGPTGEELKLLDLVNAERTARKIRPLAWDPALARLARAHAADMKAAGKISHHSTSNGADFSARLARTAYRARAAAENVAVGSEVERVHRGLMQSPGHRANILNPDLSALGIGILRDASGESIYVVEDFATPIAVLTDEEAAAKIRGAVAAARQRLGGPPLEEDGALASRLTKALEAMIDADTVKAGGKRGFGPGSTFTYTSMDPAVLPEGAGARAAEATGYALAVSYRKTRSYPFGIYWVVLHLKEGP
jgi:NADH dehydrogenase